MAADMRDRKLLRNSNYYLVDEKNPSAWRRYRDTSHFTSIVAVQMSPGSRCGK